MLTEAGDEPEAEPSDAGDARGYASAAYAAALSEFGEPLALPACGGWLLRRPIAGHDAADAMGCYPLFACRDWGRLAEDLESPADDLVSVTLVADPFGGYSEETLRRCFPDLCRRFKEHYVVDLERSTPDDVSAHHRRNARRGLRQVSVEVCDEPRRYRDDWVRLYQDLIDRHGIRGISAFSPLSLERQLEVPGLVMQRAVHEGATVGIVLWYVTDTVAYYHLGAYSPEGYELRAAFAIFSTALEFFRGKVGDLALGAGAGARPDPESGLDRFKAGWATGTRPAYLCGRILDPDLYARLAAGGASSDTGYFPAYRQGEFA